MIESAVAFHRRRAREERLRAARVENNRRAILHLELAELHAERVMHIETAKTPDMDTHI